MKSMIVMAIAFTLCACGSPNKNSSSPKATLPAHGISPQQEHFLGRAVVAGMLSRYPISSKTSLQKYLSTLGSYLVAHANIAPTFRGYHFGLVESATPFVISAPGGFILISEGMIDQMTSEDELAALMAHELAHVALRHNLQRILSPQGVNVKGQIIVFSDHQKSTGPTEQVKALHLYEKAVTVGQTLALLQSHEMDADRLAVKILTKAGYDTSALAHVTYQLSEVPSYTSRHPIRQERLTLLSEITSRSQSSQISSSRMRRFANAKRH